jgi:hypothetical protein
MVLGVGKDQTATERCREDYRKFLEMKARLHETVWQFLRDVQMRMRDVKAIEEAKRIVDLIIDDWQKVRPYAHTGKIGFDPFSQATETFYSGDWRDVNAGSLHSTLIACGDMFDDVRTGYDRLSPEEKEEAIPGGLKP